MKRILSLAFLLCCLNAVGQEPVVSNVKFSQSSNGAAGTRVDVYYDLAYAYGNCTVTASLSKDNGVTFPFPVTSATGGIGPNVAPGTGRHLVWNAGADYPNELVAQAAIKISASGPLTGGPYGVGYTSVTYQDAARSNRSVAAKIYYPSEAAGQDTPVAGAGGIRFPVIVFGHGFVISIDSYPYLWENLVPQGYILVMCNTETGILPNHGNFGQDLAFLVDRLQAEGASPASRFYGKVAPTSAVMGHSMGGGSSFLSVQYSRNITAIATMAVANTSPSAITAAASVTVPALVLAGSQDCVAAPDSNQLPMYNALLSACKYYVSITGGSHCQFAVNSTLCNSAEAVPCIGRSFIDANTQRFLVIDTVLPWLNAKLKGLASGRADFLQALRDNSGTGTVTYQGTCPFAFDAQSPAGLLDTAPPSGTIVINNNRSVTNSTNATLSLTWNDGTGSGVVRMRFSNDGATWTAWLPLAVTYAYMLPGGDGYKTVRAQFLDKAGNRSAVSSDFIRLDTTPPTGSVIINDGALSTETQAVTLRLTWSDGTGSGVARMRFSDDGAHWTAWEPVKTPRAYTLPAGFGYHTVRVQYLDAGNNYSPVYNDYIKLLAP